MLRLPPSTKLQPPEKKIDYSPRVGGCRLETAPRELGASVMMQIGSWGIAQSHRGRWDSGKFRPLVHVMYCMYDQGFPIAPLF